MKYPQYFNDCCFKDEAEEIIDQKVEALIGAMTVTEKAELCHGGINPEHPGQVGNGGYLTGVPRLGVPEIRMYDGPAGVTSIYETTGLPAEEMLASTWSRELAHEFGRVTGSENKLISGNCQLGAEVDLVRTTHFNRTRDMLGEDPYLAGALAVPLVAGIQENHVMAVLKHFAGYVVSANPANSPDIVIDEQTMHELYLAPFEQAIHEGGACGVMTCYNRINGPYAANSAPLLKDVLRRQWRFKGLTMCDWGGNHSFSLKNGMDMEMPMGAYNSTERIVRFLEEGRISMEDLNDAVRHVLHGLGAAGYLSLVALDGQGQVEAEAGRTEPIRMPDCYEQGAPLLEKNAKAAQLIAEQGAVLLKNDHGALPLSQDVLTTPQGIALVGMGAVNPICGYGQERSYGTLKYMTSPAAELGALSGHPECFTAVPGIDYVGQTVPAAALRTEAMGGVEGLKRYYGISEADGYRPPLGVGGEGVEFTGVASRDADDEDADLDFKPMDLFMPSNDAADMDGHETGSLCCVDPVIDFTCGTDNKTWKNGVRGNAFEKGSAYTWKGFLVAPEDGEYQLNLQAIGGVAVFKMDVDGTGYKDMGLVKLREGTQWPWGNLVCSPEGMEVCATRVRLQGGRSYPVLIYGKALLDLKDLQVRLAWVTPSQARAQREQAVAAAARAKKNVFFIHSGFKMAYGQADGGFSFGESTELELEAEQKSLLLDVAAAVHSHGGQLIVAAYNGSAFAMKSWIDAADALLYMWMPGQSGGRALARLLLGQAVPGGKLPQSFPNTNEDTLITDTPEHQTERWDGVAVPGRPVMITASEGIHTGYRWYDENGRRPLFEFGYGLSYTTFAYDDLKLIKDDKGVTVEFMVENTGKTAGDEIVQVYVGEGLAPAHVMTAKKRLCGFERLCRLLPGERRHVSIAIPKRCFMYWDPMAPEAIRPDGTADRWQMAGGMRRILVGASSLDIRLEGSVEMDA